MSNIELKRQPRSLRPRDEAPFCWFARTALDWIEKSPKITNQARAKLVYRVYGSMRAASGRHTNKRFMPRKRPSAWPGWKISAVAPSLCSTSRINLSLPMA